MEDIRQAAVSSNYPNRQALNQWLDIPDVMGENRLHLGRAQAAYLRAMRLCPLEPRSYIESAKLAWLSLAPRETEERLMKQALAARPFEGQVYLDYAHFLNNQGKRNESVTYYQQAYQRDVRCRSAIVTDLSSHYPPSFFIENFKMDLDSLMGLRTAFTGSPDREGYQQVLQALIKAELAESERTSGEYSATRIVIAAGCYFELGEDELAINTLLKSIRRHSNSYSFRSYLSKLLYDRGRYSEALPHLEWCHRRHPEVQAFTNRIEVASTRSDLPLQMAEQLDHSNNIR